MKIYVVEYDDYDSSDSVGYFTDRNKAEECCKYLNRTRPSYYYKESGRDTWEIFEYELDDTDYQSLNKELDEQEKIKAKEELEKEKQQAIAEITRLKEKYNI